MRFLLILLVLLFALTIVQGQTDAEKRANFWNNPTCKERGHAWAVHARTDSTVSWIVDAENETIIYESNLQLKQVCPRCGQGRGVRVVSDSTVVWIRRTAMENWMHPETPEHPRVTPYMRSHDSLMPGFDYRYQVFEGDTSYYLLR